LPEFRGPNLSSNLNAMQACGSVMAKQDIIDATKYILDNYKVDASNIYLLGGSGGGHMALLMAAYKPEFWKAVASFCPITDLSKWYYENSNYSIHIHKCCGGKPDDKTLKEYQDRSPITYIDNIAKSNTKIFHGKYDKSVPFTHTMDLFYRLSNKYPKSRVFVDIFDGGHELRIDDARNWFLSQIKKPIDMHIERNVLTK
jgi:dipeptidyl aminopeptidase/acylaminoacyl peptidase